MRYIITGKNLEVTQNLQETVEEKLKKLERYLYDDTEVHVKLSVQKGIHRIEATIPIRDTCIRSEQESHDMYTTIDQIAETLERQCRRYKNKKVDRYHDRKGAPDVQAVEEPVVENEDEIRIEKVKQFAVKPMTPEDACFEMDLTDHSFYVFRNSETNEVNVVYRRKGGSYGLIEPLAD